MFTELMLISLYLTTALGHLEDMDTPRKPVSRKDRVQIARWLETQRGRPQYRPAPHASKAAARVMKPLAKKFKTGSPVHTLKSHWPKIVGPRFAKLSAPHKFIAGRGQNPTGKTLVIEAPSAIAALIIAGSGPIIDRLNSYLGPGHVSHIKIRHINRDAARTASHKAAASPALRGLSPKQEAQLQSGLESLPNNGLKKALEGLGRGVMASTADQDLSLTMKTKPSNK